ncbi:MAG TPA: ABC transporter permease [Balneolales bacterium]|nr:ABC transporter permease [Balneolales bacterium]
MYNIFTICKREVSSFFDSLMAYIIIVVFLGLSGVFTWLFGTDIFFRGQASLAAFFGVSFWTLFFFIPAVTMRMLAEERRSGTLELLATKPITELQIVVGKWLASWLLIVFSLLPTVIYYITVANLGNIDNGAVIGGYLSLLLISGVYISIGIFASSLTSNQIVAFILSLFIAFFFQFFFDVMSPILPAALSGIFSYLSLASHFHSMSRGVLSIADIIYMLSLILLGMVLATASLRRRVWS